MFHTFDKYGCSVSVCIYTEFILVTKLKLQTYFSLLNSLKKILRHNYT